ncbi:MAG: hypothetical protein AAF985_24245 [Bacteroidota bacterium]
MFKNKNLPLLAFGTLLLLFACQQSPTKSWQPLDLLKYGVPITIMAPDSAKVKTMDLLVQKDVTIKKGEDYYVQIFSSDATTSDHKKILAELKADVKNNPYFSKFLLEEDKGFIYETVIDSTHYNYGFRHIRIQGDREYIFQTGLIGNFDQEQVEAMYDAVQPTTK